MELESSVGEGGGGGGKVSISFTSQAPPLSISFSPQHSAAIKIKDGGHNFRQARVATLDHLSHSKQMKAVNV